MTRSSTQERSRSKQDNTEEATSAYYYTHYNGLFQSTFKSQSIAGSKLHTTSSSTNQAALRHIQSRQMEQSPSFAPVSSAKTNSEKNSTRSTTSSGATTLKRQRGQSSQTPEDEAEMFDFDANLTHSDLLNDFDAIMEQCLSINLTGMLVPGATVEESKQAIELAQKYPQNIFATAGVHPYHVGECNETTIPALENLSQNSSVYAFGEFGLDYSPSFPEKELQLKWFEPQLELACKVGKPLFMHERLAHEDFIQVLSKYQETLPPVAVHCFTGNGEELKDYVKRGFYIGVTGFVCKKEHGALLRSLLHLIPLDRLLVETDAPYMGFSGCRKFCKSNPKKQYPNVPMALPRVIETIADSLSLSPNELRKITTKNARRFLRIL